MMQQQEITCLPMSICYSLGFVDVQVINLVHRCWEHEPEKRPTMTAVGMQLSNIMAAMQRRQTAP